MIGVGDAHRDPGRRDDRPDAAGAGHDAAARAAATGGRPARCAGSTPGTASGRRTSPPPCANRPPSRGARLPEGVGHLGDEPLGGGDPVTHGRVVAGHHRHEQVVAVALDPADAVDGPAVSVALVRHPAVLVVDGVALERGGAHTPLLLLDDLAHQVEDELPVRLAERAGEQPLQQPHLVGRVGGQAPAQQVQAPGVDRGGALQAERTAVDGVDARRAPGPEEGGRPTCCPTPGS